MMIFGFAEILFFFPLSGSFVNFVSDGVDDQNYLMKPEEDT